MDLRFLIPSRTRRDTLAYFIKNPDTRACGREVARLLKTPAQLVYRELLNLESWGFLLSVKQGNQRVFYLNERFPLYAPIRDLFTAYTRETQRPYEIAASYRLRETAKRLKGIPIPAELTLRLKSPRTKPRSFAESKLLEKMDAACVTR